MAEYNPAYGDGYNDDDYENSGALDGEYGDQDDEYSPSMTAEDCWVVIASFFEYKGLVSQQIDSYDEFVSQTMQSLVDEYSEIVLDHPNPPQRAGDTRDILFADTKSSSAMSR